MITENLSTLKIHKLTQEQYESALENGTLEDNAIYLTPMRETDVDNIKEELKSYIDDVILNGEW
jgi:hypothetical protein